MWVNDYHLRCRTLEQELSQNLFFDSFFDYVFFKDALVKKIKCRNNLLTPVVINAFYFCDPDGHSQYVQSKEYFPVDDRTPYLGELNFRNIKATNCHAAAAYMFGLPEQKIKKVGFENVSFSYAENPQAGVPAMMDGADKTIKSGMLAKNLEVLELKNVTIIGQDGEEVMLDGVDRFIRE